MTIDKTNSTMFITEVLADLNTNEIIKTLNIFLHINNEYKVQ